MKNNSRLKKYRTIRDFQKTSEPKGKVTSHKTKKSYFIQKHAASHLHYDLRLELNGVLKSWAIPKGPCLDPTVKRLAVHVEDHPLEYGHFEGIIPKGEYGAGSVMVWDMGEWKENEKHPNKDGDLTFELKGKKLKGLWKLLRIKSSPKDWLLIKIKDKYARDLNTYDILSEKPNSVLSKKNIHSDKMPNTIKPELATLVNNPPTGKEWLHEIKFDGYRIISYIEDKTIKIITRGNHNWTSTFKTIQNELKNLSVSSAIIDGEVVVLNEHQHSNFKLLQNAIKKSGEAEFVYYIFDLMYLNGKNLTTLPLIQRKRMLRQIIPENNPILRYSDYILGSGKKVFTKSCELGLEGIVSKNINSSYTQKRTHDWQKTKCSKRHEFIITGYTKSKSNQQKFGSLLLGKYDSHHNLIYCGRVGTGFTVKSSNDIAKKMKPFETQKIPFNKVPPDSKQVTWLKPALTAEVEFIEVTDSGVLRHPSFKNLSSEKHSSDTLTEKNFAPITHPDKVLYPKNKITKIQIYEYYDNIKNVMLPYIINRPLTLVRCPNGYTKESFYQKHPNKSTPSALKSILIKEKNSKSDYIYINNTDGLLALPQLAVLEIHPWGSQILNLEKPDLIIFDLDPADNVKWKEVVEAAYLIKKELQQLKLKSFLKSTGGKGLHIVIPIQPKYSWDEVKAFSHAFAKYIENMNPKKYISTMSKEKRRGKIFIDYMRNMRGATAIAPYSTRALLNATVATPLDWDELTQNIADTTYNIGTVLQRLENIKDPWKDYFKINQSLKLDIK